MVVGRWSFPFEPEDVLRRGVGVVSRRYWESPAMDLRHRVLETNHLSDPKYLLVTKNVNNLIKGNTNWHPPSNKSCFWIVLILDIKLHLAKYQTGIVEQLQQHRASRNKILTSSKSFLQTLPSVLEIPFLLVTFCGSCAISTKFVLLLKGFTNVNTSSVVGTISYIFTFCSLAFHKDKNIPPSNPLP